MTISRQAGAGGIELAERLVERLNGLQDRARWQCFDRELVEEVALHHQMPSSVVEAIEDSPHSWIEDLWLGMPSDARGAHLSEDQVFRRVTTTIRAIAQRGHAVIVGRGGAYATARLPGGIHIRLVAPLEFRIRNYALRHHREPREAAAEVRQIDRNRATFYRRHWPRQMLDPQQFTATFNTAKVDERRLLDAVVALLGRTD